MRGAGIAMMLAAFGRHAYAYTQIPLRLIQTAPANDRDEWRRSRAELIAMNPEMEYQMFDDERALAFARNRSDQTSKKVRSPLLLTDCLFAYSTDHATQESRVSYLGLCARLFGTLEGVARSCASELDQLLTLLETSSPRTSQSNGIPTGLSGRWTRTFPRPSSPPSPQRQFR